MGYDPSSINAAKELIKKKNVEVAALKKQLNLLASEDPMAKEIEETETRKSDMMKLIIEKKNSDQTNGGADGENGKGKRGSY